MKQIKAEKIIHRNETRIKLTYQFDKITDSAVRMIPGRKWSKNLKSWHIPYTSDAFGTLSDLCKKHNIKLIYNKKVAEKSFPESEQKTKTQPVKSNIDTINNAVDDFISYMNFRRFSKNTIKTYSAAVKKFFTYYNTKNPDEITLKDIQNFNSEYIVKNKFSVSYQNQMINALKTFYKKIYNKNLNIKLIERPVKQRHLPNVLSKQEIINIIKSIDNIKHKTIISLIYSAGLRRSELINLKIKDIDSERKTIKISDSKGNKDRYVSLSGKILDMLRSYYKSYYPKVWLFESPEGNQYSASSIRNIFEKAKQKAGIKKKITLHGLRHSYATHLHEQGIDIRVIQELLGHNSIKTTEIYTHISKKRINKIRSPLDDLDI